MVATRAAVAAELDEWLQELLFRSVPVYVCVAAASGHGASTASDSVPHPVPVAMQVVQEAGQPLTRYYRHISEGAWPFSTRDHGWPISDCTSEVRAPPSATPLSCALMHTCLL